MKQAAIFFLVIALLFGASTGDARNTVHQLSIEDALAEGESKGVLIDGIALYFGDQAILFFQIEAQGLISDLHVIEEVLSFEPYALALRRGESRLRLAVDRALSAIYNQGHIYLIITEELGDYPLPPEARAVASNRFTLRRRVDGSRPNSSHSRSMATARSWSSVSCSYRCPSAQPRSRLRTVDSEKP